jgi:hypothetical protein
VCSNETGAARNSTICIGRNNTTCKGSNDGTYKGPQNSFVHACVTSEKLISTAGKNL